MMMLTTAALLALLSGAIAQTLQIEALSGNSLVTFRVVDRTTSGGRATQITPSETFASAALNVTFVVNAAETILGAPASLGSYQTRTALDTVQGTPASASLRVYYKSSFICQTTLTNGVRQTLTLTEQFAPDPALCTTQTTPPTTGACSVANSGTKTVQCSAIVNEYVDTPRSCDALGVRLRRLDARCNAARIKRTSAAAGCSSGCLTSGEAVYLTKQFLSSDVQGSQADATLSRAAAYALELGAGVGDVPLTGIDTARAYEVTITDNGAPSVSSLTTGFFKLLNAAHRETLPQLNQPSVNEFAGADVAIEALGGGNGAVYHYEDGLQAGSMKPAGESTYFELPSGQYNVRVFSGQATRRNLYASPLEPLAPTATFSLTPATAVLDLTPNSFVVLVISTAAFPYQSVTVRPVVVTAPTPTPLGATHVIHNELTGDQALTSLRLAAFDTSSSASRCALVGSSALVSLASQSINPLSDAPFAGSCPLQTRVLKFGTGDSCATFVDSGIGGTFTLADVASPQCVVKHFFILGRTFKFNDTTPFSCSVPNGCQVTVQPQTSCTQRLVGKYGDLSTVASTNQDIVSTPTPGSVQIVTVGVPTCQCATPAPNVCNPSNCDLLKKLDDTSALVGSLSGSINAAVTNDGAKTRTAVAGAKNSCDKNGEDLDDVRKDLKQVDNKLDDLDKQADDLEKQADDIEKKLDSMDDDIGKIKKAVVP